MYGEDAVSVASVGGIGGNQTGVAGEERRESKGIVRQLCVRRRPLHKQKDGKHELSNDVQTTNGDNRRTDYETSTRQQGTTGKRAQPVRKDATEGQSL